MIALMTKACWDYDKKNQQYLCSGDWSIRYIDELRLQFNETELPTAQSLVINGEHLTHFDSSGAVFLIESMNALKKRNNQVELRNFNDHQSDLFALVDEKQQAIHYTPPRPKAEKFLYHLGKESINKLQQVQGLVILIGDLTDKLLAACVTWRRFRVPSIISIIGSTGINALPIVGLLSFLVGVVLAYQMGQQLESYGANIFIAYLSGMAIFREFGPLITAIIVAGRTSSAFTAQIGSMKINEEIDALYTMGLSPTELLVVPKVLGLLLIFPLLIFWADFFGVLGAMLMSKYMLSVGYQDFLIRLQDAVGFKQMALGLYKAPTFAILTALVGCFQGFRVQANADSVGSQTTRSVVQALFLIIVTDAAYSVIYSWLNL